MYWPFLFIVSLTFVASLPSSSFKHVIHESRREIQPRWTRSHVEVDDSFELPIQIAVTQENLDRGEEFLLEISHPSSPKYGQHWLPSEIREKFAPKTERLNEIFQWLRGAGISTDRLAVSRNRGWIKFNATVKEIQALLQTEYYVYEDEFGKPHIGCEAYSVPAHVQEHIDFITPTVQFASLAPRESLLRERDNGILVIHGQIPKDKMHKTEPKAWKWADCENIEPECLRKLYKMPESLKTYPNNSLGIVQYTPQAYLRDDLDMFFEKYSPQLVGKDPILASIDGGEVQTSRQSDRLNGESNLDLEYAMALTYPQETTLFQVGNTELGGSFNTFLDAIDASYCGYDGGDDPPFDPVYSVEDCGVFTPTKVISQSYTQHEVDFTESYKRRQCHEYMKLGLQGITILFASGDQGTAGKKFKCLDPTTGSYTNETSRGAFSPAFPSTCPFVTSVGATRLRIDAASNTSYESAWDKSGGGFSNVFEMPSYQSDAVQKYLSKHNPGYGSQVFNDSGKARAYPDISAVGMHYNMASNGAFHIVNGTSASTPVIGSILTFINQARMAAGKSSVGFINPTLYAHPEILNDVVEGSSVGCGTEGFPSAPGWDPITGLGTPDFERMYDLWMKLP